MPHHANGGSFRKGDAPWNKGTVGVMKRNSGSWGGALNPGGSQVLPVGALRWDSKHHELLVKVAEPWPYAGRYPGACKGTSGHWRPLRLVNWERAFGPVPKGDVIRRLLPGCTCLFNLVLVSRAVNAILNRGHWCRPALPWADLPLDHDARLTAVHAAIAKDLAGERGGSHYRKYNRKRREERRQ